MHIVTRILPNVARDGVDALDKFAQLAASLHRWMYEKGLRIYVGRVSEEAL